MKTYTLTESAYKLIESMLEECNKHGWMLADREDAMQAALAALRSSGEVSGWNKHRRKHDEI